MNFASNDDPDQFNFREHPELYHIGKGEEGVFRFEPYRSELLPLLHYQNAVSAKQSAQILYHRFLDYLKNNDFPGADMARKYLLMGFTRSLRFASSQSPKQQRLEPDHAEEPSSIFYRFYQKALHHSDYKLLKEQHEEQYG